MKVLLVAPGAVYSTYDCYRYYLDAMHKSSEVSVQGFNYHNMMIYHGVATDKLFPHYSQDDRAAVVSLRSARELILDAVLYKPDVVFVVSGTLIPEEVYIELLRVRHELDRPFALAMYYTESPYMDEKQEIYFKYSDVVFTNDKYSVKRFDPKGTRYVEYLPHSFDPKVHRPGNENDPNSEKYRSDVFFGGTVFKERFDMVQSINWNNVNLRLHGNWDEWVNENNPASLKLQEYLINNEVYTSNAEYAKYYRNAKIALNVHRTRADIEGETNPLDNYNDAYSIGPRIYEAAACGTFIITDYRKEAEDIFGDTIEFFDSNEDLEKKIHYWLDPEHEQERINKAQAAIGKIQNCTFNDRLEHNILPVLHEVLQLRRIKNE